MSDVESSQSSLDFFIWGTHAIEEASRSNVTRVHEIWSANERGVRTDHNIQKVDRIYLDRKLGTTKHQNIGARISLSVSPGIKSWVTSLKEKDDKKPLKFIALDQIEDAQNLGAIYRSAHFFGFDAVIIPKDHSAPLNGFTAKASAGALFSIPTIRCVNLSRELAQAETLGFWRVGMDPLGEVSISNFSQNGNLMVVLGSEGGGMRRLVQQNCDQMLRIDSPTRRDSLNVSVSAAIVMYELSKKKF